jgi:hypothetical protein
VSWATLLAMHWCLERCTSSGAHRSA